MADPVVMTPDEAAVLGHIRTPRYTFGNGFAGVVRQCEMCGAENPDEELPCPVQALMAYRALKEELSLKEAT